MAPNTCMRCTPDLPFMQLVIIAWPSCFAVLKQFSACSGVTPLTTMQMASTTCFSVCFSWFNSSTLLHDESQQRG